MSTGATFLAEVTSLAEHAQRGITHRHLICPSRMRTLCGARLAYGDGYGLKICPTCESLRDAEQRARRYRCPLCKRPWSTAA